MARWVSFDQIKSRVSIAQVLAHYGLLTKLRRRGDELLGLCPFHQEREASFRVSLARNAFHCFGCQRSGNVLDFVALREQVTIREAALLLQGWFAVGEARQTPPRSSSGGAEEPRPMSCRPSAGHQLAPPAPFHPGPLPAVQETRPLGFALRGLDPTHPYLAARGLTPATIGHFGLGYCRHGLLAGRIAIPIHDAEGRLVAYAGRWPGEPVHGEPRYRFPANFHKSRVVFNLDRATELAKENGLVLVEGFFGCFRLHQAGYPNVCALMGSTLSPRQRDLLVEALGPGGRITLWFDADAAGRRCLDHCRQALSGQVRVRAVSLPHEGVQPDQLAEPEISRALT